jgi:Domain of unknown function (DUF4328)
MDKIEVCKKCSNKKLDRDKGLVCRLTNEKPTFENTCPDYDGDKIEEAIVQEKKEAIRPNKSRAKNAIIVIWIIMGLDVISMISSYLQYDLLAFANAGGFISDEVADSNDNREMILAFIYTAVSIISIVTFIQWFRRAYYNLNIRINCKFSEGMAAGCWFIPIIALFRPYQIMKEMWVETSKLILSKTDVLIKNDGTGILALWWTIWIIYNFVGNQVIKMAFRGETIADYMNGTIGDIVLSFLGIPLAFITIRFIKLYSHKEDQLYMLEQNG